jgi:hypothetical protein
VRPDEVLLIGALVFLGAIVPVVLGVAAGSLDIPRNDDWSYRRTALQLYNTGHLAFEGLAGMMLIGQIILVQPFLWLTHGDESAFAIFGVLVAVLAPLAVFRVAREFLRPARAFIAALSVVLFPGFLAYNTSFMTDGPALVVQFLALAISFRTLRATRPDPLTLALAIGVAVVGFSVRQFALAAVAAVALSAICREPKRVSSWLISFAGLGTCVLLQVARSRLPGEVEPFPAQLWFVTRLPEAAVTVSLMVLPAALIAIAANRGAWRARDGAYGAILGGGVAMTILALWIRLGTFPTAFVGNLTTQQGVLDVMDLQGGRPYLFTDAFWASINLLGLFSTVIVGATITATTAARLRRNSFSADGLRALLGSPIGLLVAFVTLYTAGLTAFGTIQIVFDRYLWPIAAGLSVLLMMPFPDEPGRRPRHSQSGRVVKTLTIAPVTVLTMIAIMSLTLMVNAFAFDTARWRAGVDLESMGVPAGAIDAGYEWVGAHATTNPQPVHAIPTAPLYRGWWPGFVSCGVVTASPLPPPSGALVGVERYRLYLFAGPEVDLYLYRVDRAGC